MSSSSSSQADACCACYESFDSTVKINTDRFLTTLHEQWQQQPGERVEKDGDNEGLRRAVITCQAEPDRHLLCEQCAVALVKHPKSDRCPLCRGPLSHAISMCQQLWCAQKEIKKAKLRSENIRTLFQSKITNLRDRFSARLERAGNYYLKDTPRPCRFEVNVSIGSGGAIAWQRREEGKLLHTTLSGTVSEHDTLDEKELRRLVEHTTGIRLDTTSSMSRRSFITECDQLRDDIVLWTHWPRNDSGDEESLDDYDDYEDDDYEDDNDYDDGVLPPLPTGPPPPPPQPTSSSPPLPPVPPNRSFSFSLASSRRQSALAALPPRRTVAVPANASSRQNVATPTPATARSWSRPR